MRNHYEKHVAPNLYSYLSDEDDETLFPMTQQEYNEEANRLSKQEISTSDYSSEDNYIGFYGKDALNRPSIYKFDKKNSTLVIYYANELNAKTVSYYKMKTQNQKERYERLKRKHYIRELTMQDDLYNR